MNGHELELVGVPVSNVDGLQIVVEDVEVVRQTLASRGEDQGGRSASLGWGSFIYFSDPHDNTWSVQQVPRRG